MRYLLSSILLLAIDSAFAQTGVEMLSGRPIDPNRYVQIKGSPYLFDAWVNTTIIASSGTPIEGVPINFNGYTQNFESIRDGRMIELELGYFIGMKLEADDPVCGKQSFLKFYHPKLINKYPLFIFNGKKYRLIKNFHVNLVENRVETPGKTEKFKSFSPDISYYLMTGTDLEFIKLNRKDILQKLDQKEAANYVDANKLDLTTETGVCQLLSFLDAQ